MNFLMRGAKWLAVIWLIFLFKPPSSASTEVADIIDLAAPGVPYQSLFNADRGDTRVSNQQVAQAVASGDLNHDGIEDLIVGAPVGEGPDNRRQSSGEVHVFFGEVNAPPASSTRDAAEPPPPDGSGADVILYGPGRSFTGWSIAVGDISGDGIDDVIVGAQSLTKPSMNGAGSVPVAGGVYVIFGGAHVISGTRLDLAQSDVAADLTVYGPHAAALTGWSVSAGDINGDAIADLIIGSPGANKLGMAQAFGAVYILWGGPDLVGIRDLGAPEGSPMGASVAIYGADASNRITGDQLGVRVAAGDLDGDSIEDLLMSAPLADGPENGRRDAGEVYALFGGDGILRTQTVVDLAVDPAGLTVYGETAGAQLGLSLASGDVDGDGVSDLLAGSPLKDQGIGYVVYGQLALPPGSTRDLNQADSADIILVGPENKSSFGVALTSGDINGDGIRDIVAGADMARNAVGDESGIVYVFYGRSGLPKGTRMDAAAPPPPGGAGPDVTVLGIDRKDQLGLSLYSSDINGDGIDDLFMAAPGGAGPTNSRSGAGESYVLYGSR